MAADAFLFLPFLDEIDDAAGVVVQHVMQRTSRFDIKFDMVLATDNLLVESFVLSAGHVL